MGSAKRTEFRLFKTIKKIEKRTETGKRKWCAHSRNERVKKSRKRQGSIREKVELTEMVFHSGGQKD